MKVLLQKLKKTNKALLITYILTSILYLITYVLFIINLCNLSGIETTIRIILILVFGIWLFIYLIWNLINLILKKFIKIIITSTISIILAIIFSFANHYIDMLYSGITNIGEEEYITYTSNLVVLNGATITKNSKLGMINNTSDIEGNILAKELIQKRKLDVIGTQELTPRTKDYLEKRLEDYIFVGESRGSASISDEYNSILLKKEVFDLLDTKTYSLSNDINKKGGRFLLDFFPRICTVAHTLYEGITI